MADTTSPDPLRGVLVTGGAGYIGSHVVRMLAERGIAQQLLVLDNLSEGYRQALADQEDVQLIEGDLDDADLLKKVFAENQIDAVLHFAAFIQVGESVTDPLKYYRNNTARPMTLLEAMRDAGCAKFIFSSTAAVYGDPDYVPIDEAHPKRPINPYGSSKHFLEQVLADCGVAHGLRSVCLRYFNASGSALDGRIGEGHDPETHLIPRILMAISGATDSFTIFGTDYPTPDGTCIRDFIHVLDLGSAHIRALEYLVAGGESLRCNLGTGSGFSVKEMVDAAEKVTGQKVPLKYGERREGDPPRLVADSSLAKQTLGWEVEFPNIEDIVRSAWQWFGAEHKGRYPKKS